MGRSGVGGVEAADEKHGKAMMLFGAVAMLLLVLLAGKDVDGHVDDVTQLDSGAVLTCYVALVHPVISKT